MSTNATVFNYLKDKDDYPTRLFSLYISNVVEYIFVKGNAKYLLVDKIFLYVFKFITTLYQLKSFSHRLFLQLVFYIKYSLKKTYYAE